MLVTQKYVGEDTNKIKEISPATYDYLLSHSSYKDQSLSLY
jgi:hypothetical protein